MYTTHLLEKTQPSEDELLALLCKFARTMSVTFYILDAVDEAPAAIQLDLIQKLASLDVKLFITSRPLKALEAQFPEAYCFPIFAQNEDLDLHIADEISRSVDMTSMLKQADASFRDTVVTSIKEKCEGM